MARSAWRYSQDMLDWSRCEAVERDPSIDQFLEWFPGVPRCHVEVVLEHVARSLTETRA